MRQILLLIILLMTKSIAPLLENSEIISVDIIKLHTTPINPKLFVFIHTHSYKVESANVCCVKGITRYLMHILSGD